MRSGRLVTFNLGLAASLVATLALAGTVAAGGRPLTADLVGANEVPGPGDPDGSGWFEGTFNPGTGEVCYAYEVTGVDPLRAAHIHVAPPDAPGPVVIPLEVDSDTGGSGCVTADPELVKAIIKDPDAYYVNVHNVPFPAGALRGQLSR